MTGTFRPRRPSAATVVAFIALFVALSGTSLGQNAVSAAKKLVTGKQIKNGSVTSADVRNGSLQAKDFKPGQLTAGPQGAQGPQGVPGATGPAGPKGATGTVDTSLFYTKVDSDTRFALRADSRPYAAGEIRGDASVFGTTGRFNSVTHPTTGIYCLLLSGTPEPQELNGTVVTLAGTTAQALFPHVTNGQGADCATEPAPHVSIRFYTAAGQLSDARFAFMVP